MQEKQTNLFACAAPKSTMTQTKLSIFIDGAARNNPGPAGAGIYVTHGNKILIKQGYYLGEKTNNQAEYLALLLALFLTNQEIKKQNENKTHLEITSDSELLVKQMHGAYKVKNPILHKIKTIIMSLLEGQSYTFHHVLREKNKIADSLANQGIDKKKEPPSSFKKLLNDHEMVL